MGMRGLDRRRGGADLLFADDTGAVEPDRRGEDRRQSPRYAVQLWAEQLLPGEASIEVLLVSELSETGAFVVRDSALPLGQRLELLMTLPREVDAIRPVGRVASQRETPGAPVGPRGYGVAFEELSPADAARIARYLGWIRAATSPTDAR